MYQGYQTWTYPFNPTLALSLDVPSNIHPHMVPQYKVCNQVFAYLLFIKGQLHLLMIIPIISHCLVVSFNQLLNAVLHRQVVIILCTKFHMGYLIRN